MLALNTYSFQTIKLFLAAFLPRSANSCLVQLGTSRCAQVLRFVTSRTCAAVLIWLCFLAVLQLAWSLPRSSCQLQFSLWGIFSWGELHSDVSFFDRKVRGSWLLVVQEVQQGFKVFWIAC